MQHTCIPEVTIIFHSSCASECECQNLSDHAQQEVVETFLAVISLSLSLSHSLKCDLRSKAGMQTDIHAHDLIGWIA